MQKQSRRLRLSLGFGTLFVCVWLGCSNDGETSTGSSGSIETCVRACERQAAANCSGGPVHETCSRQCSTIAADAECGSAYLVYTTCAATEAVFSCTASGNLEMSGCWAEAQPYAVCAACRVSPASDACERCELTSCCAERKAYWGDPNHGPFFECAAACVERDAGSACDCDVLYPSVPQALSTMFSCQRDKCAAVCP